MSEGAPGAPRLDVLARRVEPLLWLVALIFAYEAVSGGGMARVLFGPAAVGLTLLLGLHRRTRCAASTSCIAPGPGRTPRARPEGNYRPM